MNITEASKHELCKALWLENEPKLRKLCAFKLNSHPDEVEDILAEAALIFWTAIINGKTIQYPNSWLYATVNNLIKKKYTELNAEKNRKVDFTERNIQLYSLSVGYDFESIRLTDELIEKFSMEIDSFLSPEEIQLYKYVYDDNLKMKEIADLLSSTESAVKQKNYRLHRKVKKLVKDYLENL